MFTTIAKAGASSHSVMSAALAVTMSATFVVLVPATTVSATTMSAAVRAEVVTGTVRGVVGDPLHPGLELVFSHAGVFRQVDVCRKSAKK